MDHIPVGVQAQFSLMTTLFTAVVHQQSEVGHKIQGTVRCATDWAKSRDFKFSTQKTGYKVHTNKTA